MSRPVLLDLFSGAGGAAKGDSAAIRMSRKPVLLDLFCGAGGASVGYAQAGFDVVGVDIAPMPRYPFRFVQGDALDVLAGWDLLPPFDAIHASPPCQAYSSATAALRLAGKEYPDLVGPTRRALERTGVPWVMENVPGSPLRADFRLCGCMFELPGLRRDRWFETSWRGFSLRPPCHHVGQSVSVAGHGAQGRLYRAGVRQSQADRIAAMGIDWMNRDELSLAIPPAYTRFIGEQVLAHLAADPRPGPGPKPAGPTGPQPTHPPSMPPPVPTKTSTLVPSVCEPSGHGAPSGTRAAQPYLRGAGCAAHQTPAVAFRGVGGGG